MLTLSTGHEEEMINFFLLDSVKNYNVYLECMVIVCMYNTAAKLLRYIKDWATRVHAMIDGRGQVIVEIDYSIVPFSLLLKYVVFM